jgi:hypothetical protein
MEADRVERAEQRWVLIGVILVALLIVGQVVGGGIARTDAPSYLEKVQTCLTERSTPYETVVDPIALSADRGALRTSVDGNGVTVALGGSEDDAKRIYDDYGSVGSPGPRLERNRKVVFLWDREPNQTQRDFMILCTLDAQE